MSIIPTSVLWLLALLLSGWLLLPVLALAVLIWVVLTAEHHGISAEAPTPFIAPRIEHPTAASCRSAMPAGA